jgi:hypothetical protein
VLTVQELGPWDGPAALMIDGGSEPIERPPVHLQAAAGGYLRLVGPEGVVLWGRIVPGSYGVDIVRAKGAALHALPPLRADQVDRLPAGASSTEFVSWWTRRNAELLCASASTPLACGRRYLLAPTHSVATTIPRVDQHVALAAPRSAQRPDRAAYRLPMATMRYWC